MSTERDYELREQYRRITSEKPETCLTCGSKDIDFQGASYFCRACKAGTFPHGDFRLKEWALAEGLLVVLMLFFSSFSFAQQRTNVAPSLDFGLDAFQYHWRLNHIADTTLLLRVKDSISIQISPTVAWKLRFKSAWVKYDTVRSSAGAVLFSDKYYWGAFTFNTDTSSTVIDTAFTDTMYYSSKLATQYTAFGRISFVFLQDSLQQFFELRKVAGSGNSTVATLRSWREWYPFLADSIAVIKRTP